MEIGFGSGLALPLVLLAIAGGGLVLGVVASRTWQQRGRDQTVRPAPEAIRPEAIRPEATGFEQTLRTLYAAGQWDELLRLLDQTLPEWPVSSSLIEVARAVSALDRDIAATQGSVVSEVVTSRLTQQTRTVADGLWSLADRIVVADRLSSPLARDQLAREDEVLLRLVPAMREAQAELTELTLAGSGGDELRRAEGRFLALAATARELQEFGPGPTPR